MKKIGILTFHRAINYGAVLQAYALKRQIEKIGHHAQIINYKNETIEKMYSVKSFFACKGLKNKIRHFLYSKNSKEKIKAFTNFRQEYLGCNDEQTFNRDNITDTLNLFDCFITGSDQVWNPDAHGMDLTYYLDFVSDSNKKFSYAASFGGDKIPEEYKEGVKKSLESFAVCSVRETQGVSIIKKLINDMETRVDIDPVFLLSKEEWQSTFNIKKQTKKYVLVYSLTFSNLQKQITIDLYNKGYSVVMIGRPRKNPFPFPCQFIATAGPERFMELISNASYVVTNSFHGTAFSIIFNIPMSIELYKGDSSKVNARLQNVVEIFGLTDRIVDCMDDYLGLNVDINWDKVNELLRKEQDNSNRYINEVILSE